MNRNLYLSVSVLFLFLWQTPVWAQETIQSKLEQESLVALADEAQRFGDANRGALVFFRQEMNCARCHDSGDSGRRLGPDLTEKREIQFRHLVESILHPSRQIKQGYETIIVRNLDGEIFSGVLIEQNEDEIRLDRIEELDQPLVIPESEIDEWKKSATSSMPEQLANQLNDRQEFLDLIRYLYEIADGGKERAAQLRPDDSYFVTVPLPEYESRVDHRSLLDGLDRDAFERGSEIYRIRCASCHGTKEKEGSMPTSLRFASGKFKNGGDPYSMYQTLTHGYGMMNAQRWMVPRQKYDVIHFIREHFVKPENPSQFVAVDTKYLAGLPVGDTLGPKPRVHRPWSDMDYGPSLNNTIEVSKDGSNIAQKGIVVRLDPGPGGVAAGNHWLMYDHDTMRVAGAWSGNFIDYNGIHFNGVHGRHPKVTGANWFANPVGPGWGRPEDDSFEDDRVVGRDGKKYGPLPKSWLRFHGLYRFGQRTLLRYNIGDNEIVESPSLAYIQDVPVMLRQFNIAPNSESLVLQVLQTDKKQVTTSQENRTILFSRASKPKNENVAAQEDEWMFDGRSFVQDDQQLDMTHEDFTIYAEIKTRSDGTIFCQTKDQARWLPNGKTFFIRGGRLRFDIGWVGVLSSRVLVNDGRWHKVAVTWRAEDGRTQFFIDGKLERSGELEPEGSLDDPVNRIGFTNQNFPEPSPFRGSMGTIRYYDRCLSESELENATAIERGLVKSWSGDNKDLRWFDVEANPQAEDVLDHLLVSTTLDGGRFQWEQEQGNLRLRISPSDKPTRFSLIFHAAAEPIAMQKWESELTKLAERQDIDLYRMLKGGPASWPQALATEVAWGRPQRGFQVDVLTRPETNPWDDRMRLTGVDFLNGGKDAIVCCWDGTVYRVNGIDEASTAKHPRVTWRRIAAGLFQPLGVRIVNDQVYICCRDQLVRLHDLNGDGEMDWYENFNSDHQVTEHFHEFAMGLQTDDDGNFYYAKSARHALQAVVPHHGTLLKVSQDGTSTEIIANGFRAANGVCLNPDGSFIVTDQEGHWNPKNRINWVQKGGFYGNMFGYHDVTDESDEAMEPPLCWITNAFDRSPGELLWVTSDRWQPLKGSLLNFSYGMGQIFVVPHESVDGQVQGGMCALPIKKFPTGVMRGRFNPRDGQLYCCGMFAWAGNQQQPGGFYRVRYVDESVHLPVELNCSKNKLRLRFSDDLQPESASEARNFQIETWDLRRTKNYGSKHYNEQRLIVESARLLSDNRTVELIVPELRETWCMKIRYALSGMKGDRFSGEIHNTIHSIREN